jgi:hypothetical protein
MYTDRDAAEVFDKVRDGRLEIRPLFYDGSGRHPRYHFNDPPFEGQWFWWLMLVYAVFYILIILPIAWIEHTTRCIYEKIA